MGASNTFLLAIPLSIFLQMIKLEKERHELTIQNGILKKEKNKFQHLLEKTQRKEEKAAKGRDIRVGKKEREGKMKEEREKRKTTMAAMDMKGRSIYLEEEIARLEEENHVSHLNLFGHTDYKMFHFFPLVP